MGAEILSPPPQDPRSCTSLVPRLGTEPGYEANPGPALPYYLSGSCLPQTLSRPLHAEHKTVNLSIPTEVPSPPLL